MKRRPIRPVGFRTIKTALAALLVLTLCDLTGHMDYVLALIGVYCAMERTIAASWRGCLTQFFGVLVGSVLGFLLLLAVPSPAGWVMALGLVVVISVCNALKISYAAFLASTIFVSICAKSATAVDILYRVRDVSLGLAAGLCVNLFVHPYSAAPRVYARIRSLQRQALACVEQSALFGRSAGFGDCREAMLQLRMERSGLEKLPLTALSGRAKREMAALDACIALAGRMAQEAEAICAMQTRGEVSAENRARLLARGCAAPENEMETAQDAQARTVLNYHLEEFLRAYDALGAQLPPERAREKKRFPFWRKEAADATNDAGKK